MFEVRRRTRLPHWHIANRIYSITFNLFDALPRAELERIENERKIRIAELERLKQRGSPAELHAINELIRERIEETLDTGCGSCFMNNESVARIVANAITFFNNERYDLYAWCVMPNHVHVIAQIFDRLDRVLESWKSYSAKEANKVLGRTGKFWQDDYWDRLVRNPDDLQKKIKYVLNNPAKAGLYNWKWVGERASRPQSPAAPAGD
jgi:REP element-mobilizing transposase RayT